MQQGHEMRDFPSSHLTAVTDRELGIGGRSELRLARHPDDGVLAEAQSSADFGGPRSLLAQPHQLLDALSRPAEVRRSPIFCSRGDLPLTKYGSHLVGACQL